MIGRVRLVDELEGFLKVAKEFWLVFQLLLQVEGTMQRRYQAVKLGLQGNDWQSVI